MSDSLERTVIIRLRNYAYEPSSFAMKLGERVVVELRNDSETSHYFGGPELKRYMSYQSPTPNIEIPPRASRRVRLTAIRAGTATFTCFVPMHEKHGMVGTIAVEGY